MLESNLSVELDEKILDQLQSVDLEQWELDAILPLALGVEFFRHHWISLGQAAMVAEMDLSDFMRALAERDTPVVGLTEKEVNEELTRVRGMIGMGGGQ
ncbi:MAG: UPF0175 family protein [Planctomycetota bacterium]